MEQVPDNLSLDLGIQNSTRSQSGSRAEWISLSSFHRLSDDQVLNEVIRRVRALKAAAGELAHPVVLLDLDSTLFEVGPRTLEILREWIETAECEAFPTVRSGIGRLSLSQVGYSLKDTFASVGLNLRDAECEGALKLAKAFWVKRFFNSSYLKHDRAYPGAAEFVQELYREGAELVYLTGRDEPGMGNGTREMLLRDGFPWAVPRTHLLLKPSFEMDDASHKLSAADFVKRHGTLVASFENEPFNLVTLSEVFPEAMHIFVETICSDRPAPVGAGLYRIRGFGSQVRN